MASRTLSKQGLSEAFIREQLLLAAEAGKPLFQVWFDGPIEEGAVSWRSACYLLRCRAGGFMVILPYEEPVAAHLSSFQDVEGNNIVAMYDTQVLCESARGRPAGSLAVILADLPWSYSGNFKKAAALRLSGIPMYRFVDNENAVRPQKAAAWDASEEWLARLEAEEPLLEEYLTAAEEQQAGEAELVPDAAHLDQSDIVRQLQARVVELEAQQSAQQQPAAISRGNCFRPVRPLWIRLHGRSCKRWLVLPQLVLGSRSWDCKPIRASWL